MKTIKLDEIELAVVDRGAGPVVLLVHGFPFDHAMWRPQIEHLAADYRVIAPDLRGFGQSTVTDGKSSMERLADDLARMLDALGIDEPITYCGLSMGGYIAWPFWLAQRQRVRRFILCDTRAAADGSDAVANRLKMVENVKRNGTKVVAEAMLLSLFASATHDRLPEVVDYARQTILATDPRTIIAVQRGMAERRDMREYLSGIDVPALVVVGEEDAITPVDEMRKMSAAMPRAEFQVVENAGHMAPLENAAAVNAALDAFLTRS